MKHINIILIIIVFSITACKSIQTKRSFKYEALADAYLKTYQYANAIKYFEKAFFNRNEPVLAFKLGDCYWLNRDFDKAEKCYTPFILEFKNNAKYCKRYAQIATCTGNYSLAKKWWEFYGLTTGFDVKIQIASCDSSIIWSLNKSNNFEIKALEILNTKYAEISPSFYPNGIVFASSRPGMFIEKESGSTGEPYFDLYNSNFNKDSIFIKPSFFSLTLNSPEHETSAVFDSSGTTVYYTRGETDTSNTLKIKILQSEKKLINWSVPKQFILNDSLASFGQPFMNSKGTVFVFASDMKGGYGGTDLYISFKKSNTWTKPENLGPIINSSENEYYPFLTSKGDLYFTSDGHFGMGGYDIFVSKFTSQGWVNVENLKPPINSSYDDLSFIISPLGFGYFSSNRVGGKGKEDLYKFVYRK